MSTDALVERQPRSSICRIAEWRPIDGNPTLAGRCTVTFGGGWTIAGVPIFRRADGTLSAGVPSIPLLGADGTHLRDDSGKKRYLPIVTFESDEARTRWRDAIADALADAGIGGGP